MLNVGDFVRRMLTLPPPPMTADPVRPDPGPPPPPSADEMRWAKRETDAILRRARALDIEVDLERW